MTEPGGPTRPSGAMGPTEPNDEPIRRIEAALTRLGAEHDPPPGWEARVLAAVATRQRRPWWMYAAPGFALAAAAAVAIVILLPRAPPPQLALDVTTRPGAVVRGSPDERVIGDTVQIAATGARRHLAVRVYRDEVHLVISCPESLACRISRDAAEVDLKIAEVGSYTVVAATSNDPLPVLTGKLDADSAALTRAGVTEQKTSKWIVR